MVLLSASVERFGVSRMRDFKINFARIAKTSPRTSHHLSRCQVFFLQINDVTITTVTTATVTTVSITTVTISVLELCHNFIFRVWTQFEILNFVTI